MPSKLDKVNVTEKYDRRRKLQDYQRDEIKHKYATGLYSLGNLAEEYGVSKKLILLIVNPEAKRKSDEYIKEHWKNYAKNHTEAMRKHREYKKQLRKEGKI